MTSSASTRISDGRTRFAARYRPSASIPSNAAANVAASVGSRCARNGRPRPTQFSHIRLCDSSNPSDTDRHSGERSSSAAIPFWYIAWPASWITAQTQVPT